MKTKIRQQIIDTILASNRVLITAHKSPDGDSLGSQLGMAGFLRQHNIPYAIVNEGDIPDKFAFLPGAEEVRTASSVDGEFDTAIVIECSNLARIGEVQSLLTPECTVINIDHHLDNTDFGRINLKETEAAAAGVMVYDILRQADATIDEEIAINLYTAILTDTGRFHYNSTTPYCLKVAAHLLELGVDTVEITENIYYNLRPQVVRLTGMAVAAMRFHMDGRVCLLTVDREMMRRADAGRGDTEGLVNYSMYSSGVRVGVLFTEVSDGETKISFRSQDAIDVAAIAAHFGGGGHRNASGCMIPLPLTEAKERVVTYLEDTLDGSL